MDIGSLGGQSTNSAAINNLGQITGYSNVSGVRHAFFYSNGIMSDLGIFGGKDSKGVAINDSGQICIQVTNQTVSYYYASGFIYSHGVITALTPLGTAYPPIWGGAGINNSGQVIGYSSTSIPNVGHSFIYANGVETDLDPNNLHPGLGGNSINNSGQISGGGLKASANASAHACIYSGTAIQDLGTFGGAQSNGLAINEAGWVTGYSQISNGNWHAFLYSQNTMRDLGVLNGYNQSWGFAINNLGQIVGYLTSDGTSGYNNHAFLWAGGVMKDLNTLIAPNSGVVLTDSSSINDSGQIVANGFYTSTGQSRAFLLTPVPRVVLLLHGFQGTPESWNKFMKDIGGAVTTITNGHLHKTAKAIGGVYYYALRFGAYDTTSGRADLLGNQAIKMSSGDFETFDTLGIEVKAAVEGILNQHASAQVLIVAHSRGGLSARAFLQGSTSPAKSAVIGLITLGTPHSGSYFGLIGSYLASNSRTNDPDTWALVDRLRAWYTGDQVDALRPTVGDLAIGGTAITQLAAGVSNLPVQNVIYCNYVFIGGTFGELLANTLDLGNIFEPSCQIGHLSEAAKVALIGNTPYGQIGGDGIVHPSSQRMDTLHGLPANIDVRVFFDSNGVFHTDEHDQTPDISAAIHNVFGW